MKAHLFIQKEAVDAVIEYVPDYYVLYGNWKRSDNYDSLNWFLNNVYPELSTSLKFKVIGIGLSEKFQNIIRGYDNIEYLGFVENPYHIIANAKALISPLHTGAGVKVKVVESLACGTPVIGTEIAFEGISEKYSKFMILANSPSEFVQQINQISFSIETRLEFKKKFLELFNDKPVLKYIEGL